MNKFAYPQLVRLRNGQFGVCLKELPHYLWKVKLAGGICVSLGIGQFTVV